MANLTVIKKDVIDLLNANEFDSDGVKQYSAESGDEDFLTEAISRGIEKAKMVVAEKVCLSDNSTLKKAFIQENQDIEHGDLIPTHYGNIFNIKIIPYSGADPIRGQKRTPLIIDSFRQNPDKCYGQFNHNEEDTSFENPTPSQLSGFYSDQNDLFEFTGESATINYADFTDTDLADYPVSLEVPIAHIAVGLMAKDGSVSNKFGEHLAIGMSLLGDVITDKKESV